MAAKPSRHQTGSVSPGLIAGAVILLLAFIAGMAYLNLASHNEPYEPKKTAEGAQTDAWITQKAKESGGDITKLTPEDRDKLQKLTRGFGAMALQTMLKQAK